MLSRFKVCKYETGIFVQKIYVYCMKMIKNILFEVLLIALPIYIFPTCLAIGGCHAKKTVALLRQTSHRAIFVHFRKKWSAGQKMRVPSMQINSNRTELSLVSKPRAKVFPNWMLQSFPWPVLLYVMVHYHEAFVLPFLIFWSFFTQSLIQIDHLLSVALSINDLVL